MTEYADSAFKANYRDLTLNKQWHFAIQSLALIKAAEEISDLTGISQDAISFTLLLAAKAELKEKGDREVEQIINNFDELVEQTERLEKEKN